MSETAVADLVLRGGNVITMRSEKDRASAIAVADGEIVYVGDDEGAAAYVGEDTKVIELAGKTVTPGFVDGHIHAPGPHQTAKNEVNLLDFGHTLEAYKAAVAEHAATHPDLPKVYGLGMDLKVFPGSNPENSWLNELGEERPIEIHDVSGHGILMNDVAIKMAGVTKDTPNPPSGVIYHTADGELTGYFSDCFEFADALPDFEYTDEELADAFESFEREANSYGLTAIDSGGDVIPMRVYHQMELDGRQTVRVNKNNMVSSPMPGDDEPLAFDVPLGAEFARRSIAILEKTSDLESDMVRNRQLKIKIDGVPEGKSSFLLEPWAPEAGLDPDFRGTSMYTQEEVNEFVAEANRLGYAVQAHCMGDASVNLILNACEYSIRKNGNRGFRNKIAHVNLITDDDKRRLADYGVVAAMQPLWFFYDPIFSPLEKQMLGKERFEREYHIKDMIEQGDIITGSNDYAVTPDFAPLHAMQSGATQCSPYPGERQDPAFTRNADQAVSMYEMLKMYTVNGAWGAFMDGLVGTVEVGKRADLAVLDQDILSCDVNVVADTKVVYTISNGRIVYEG